MPVEADDGGVITQIAAGGAQNGRAERVNEFTGMHAPATPERLSNIEPLRVAFQHSIGHEHDSVSGLQRELLQPKRPARFQTEGEINVSSISSTRPCRNRNGKGCPAFTMSASPM